MVDDGNCYCLNKMKPLFNSKLFDEYFRTVVLSNSHLKLRKEIIRPNVDCWAQNNELIEGLVAF